MLKVCLAGATGWMGIPLSQEISKAADLSLVGAVSRTHRGKKLSALAGEPKLDVTISGSVAEALQTPADVLVDYTRADVVKSNVMTAISKGIHAVIGSSGLTDPDYAEIDEAARTNKVGVIACGNFAISAILLQRFACEAARFLKRWEIIDYASASKVDAPSGMTRELSYHLSLINKPEVLHPIEKTVGAKESRGVTLNGSQIHSIRLPGYVIGVEIIFGETEERLTLRYDAGTNAAPYLQGTLLAIRKVKEIVGLVRGLDHLLGFE